MATTTADLIRRFFARSAQLSDCAEVIDMSDHERLCYELRPTSPNAVGVAIGSEGGSDWINFTDPLSTKDEWRVELYTETVDFHIDAAVDGRVRAWHGPSRGIIEVHRPDGGRPVVTRYYSPGLGKFIPRPGWRSNATVVEYEPYR